MSNTKWVTFKKKNNADMHFFYEDMSERRVCHVLSGAMGAVGGLVPCIQHSVFLVEAKSPQTELLPPQGVYARYS